MPWNRQPGREANGADIRGVAQPCLCEIQLFGMPAMAKTRDRPKNWLIAARNVLEAAGTTSTRAAA
jgi:hypothetical protein